MSTESKSHQSTQQSASHKQPAKVVITGIDVPFFDWVTLLIKITIAAIPAYFLIVVVGSIMFLFLSLFGAGIGAMLK